MSSYVKDISRWQISLLPRAITLAGLLTIYFLILIATQNYENIEIPIAYYVVILAFPVILIKISFSSQNGSQNKTNSEKIYVLEEAVRHLELTEASAKVGHWRLNLLTNKVFWSAGCLQLHGLKDGETPELGDAINFYHPDDRKMVADAIEASRLTAKPLSFKACLQLKSGDLRYVMCTSKAEYSEDGQITGLFGVIIDRTEDEEMQRELRAARDSADAMTQAKSAFFARMSHEIRTPMNGVIGFADLLSISDLDGQQERYVDLIRDSGKSLQTLLNDILDLSKIKAGEFEIRSGPTNLRHLIGRTTQLFEPQAMEKAIYLKNEINVQLPDFIRADGLRLRQIISNLFSNAIRFTERGGIVLRVEKLGSQITFAVSDTGTGISPNMLEAIFDPFAQETSLCKKHTGGTGLGLAISRELAELMGGTLMVESTVGKGSTFTLMLPFVPAKRQRSSDLDKPKCPRSDAHTPSNSRILLVEDYDINQELICDMGRRIGLSFEIAEDGQLAVDAVLTAENAGVPFALVLMDLQMPVLGGLDAARAIRDAGIDADKLPILALTANAFADDLERCLKAGMQEHIAKPVELYRLHAAMEKWLPNYENRRSLPANMSRMN
jgi:two-component system, sensor histidine kinase